jgi:ABC-type antimicrobial peptide transport system permease subunit
MASLFLFFAITALLIANLGVYGFFAYSVRRRARELALRIALGGSPRQIFMAVCGRFPGYLGCGILAGGAIAIATVRAARHFVFGVDVFDMASFLAASFVVILSASFIAALAGRKAWNTDPAGILREE